MVRLEIGFITGPSCAASVNRPRARAVDAHRSIFTVWTLPYKHTYNLFSGGMHVPPQRAAPHAQCPECGAYIQSRPRYSIYGYIHTTL